MDDLPKSATCTKWFEITRRLVQNTIDELDLDPAAMSEAENLHLCVVVMRGAIATGQRKTVAMQFSCRKVSLYSAIQP